MVRVRHEKKYSIIKPVIHQEGSMQFNRNYLVHYYEAGADRRLTLPALIQYFEDIAILHSTERGLDLDYYEKNHCGWMLIKWDVKVHALPCFGENVLVETRVHAMKSFMADREFRMRAEDGTVLAEARSNWLLVDTVRRRPIRIPEDQLEKFPATEEAKAFVAIEDVPVIDVPDGAVPRDVLSSYSDMDTNGHVNNVRYIEWAIDSLPETFLRGKVPVAARVQYRRELAPSSAALVYTETGEGRSRHRVYSEDTDYCTLEITWGPA